MKYLLFLLSFLIALPTLAAEYIKGTIEKSGEQYIIKNANGETPLLSNKTVMDSIPSLESPSYVVQSNGKKYAFEFKGTSTAKGFILDQVPTNIAGEISETGILNYDAGTNSYSINGKKAVYGYTKVLNGYEFDDISKQAYVGTEVLAEGHINKDGVFVMNAITPANLFTANAPTPAPTEIQNLIDERGAWDFTYKVINKNEYSQRDESFRTVFYEEENNPVVPGDDFLVITLSGRQGDSFGSINGHMVAGIGNVRDDMTLRGEVSNAYVTNGKDILSGNTSLTNYFSHLVQGQNNYRPTYTFIAYGVDKAKLQQFRDALEESHIQFRTQKLSITPQFNCTTETVKALRNAGIVGNYKKWDNALLNIITKPLPLFGKFGKDLNFTLGNDASLYQPRPAYNAFAGVFLRSDLRKKLGIKRVDFVFYAQTPSDRPIGGTANWRKKYALKFKKSYEKYEVNEETKLDAQSLRPILEKELQIIE